MKIQRREEVDMNRTGQAIKKTQAAEIASVKELDTLQRPTWGNRADWENEALWSEILPGLWQGGTEDWDVMGNHMLPKYDRVARITLKDFATVVTLYASAKPVDWHVRELRFGMWDSNLQDVDFEDIFDIVQMAHSDWSRGKKVLIRCQAGWNRSGLITALVLIREGYTAAEAIHLIRQQRSSWALCNPDFVEFLLAADPADWQGACYKETFQWDVDETQD
jgi:protein tyrosine phosphatase